MEVTFDAKKKRGKNLRNTMAKENIFHFKQKRLGFMCAFLAMILHFYTFTNIYNSLNFGWSNGLNFCFSNDTLCIMSLMKMKSSKEKFRQTHIAAIK